MINERKLSETELDTRVGSVKGLLKNKRALVKKYGKDAEKVMYGIATKQAKKKVENMNLDKIKGMVEDALKAPVKEASPFVLAADAARDAGKKEFEFPKDSGKMHPVTIKQDIDEEVEEVNYSIELLVPEVSFDVESGALADSPYEFGTEEEIEDGEVDVTTYEDGDELDEWVFGRSYEQALRFAKEYPNLIKINTGELKEDEDRFVASSMEDLEQVIRNLAHTANIS